MTTACDPLPSLSGLDKDAVYNPVLLTTWGDCHYAQKVKNAEMAGAKMVILVLRHDMDANHPTVRQLRNYQNFYLDSKGFSNRYYR